MRKIVPLLFIVFCFFSCNDDSAKAATELCDCFSSKVKKPSSDFKKLMKKIAEADVPSKAFKTEFEKLDEDVKINVKAEIDKLIETDEATVAKCTKDIADYKIKGADEEARAKKIVELMAGESGCEVGSGQWALAVEQTYKNGNKKNTDTADEDEPKKPKKKVAEEEEQ